MSSCVTDTASEARGPLDIRVLDRLPYAEALELQYRLRDERLRGELPDTVLLLEHPDVITLGRGSSTEHVHLSEGALRAAGYDVHRVNRGGDVTYHGPGQLVGYPILDLRAHGADLHGYLRLLEGVLIASLADFGVKGIRRRGFSGVWLDERRKIASIGVGVRRWVSMHGFALNVSCDLERFRAILPCGLAGVEMTSLSRVLGREADAGAVRERVAVRLREALA